MNSSTCCLVIVFNHNHSQNVPLLRRLYGSRFSHLLFLMPFCRDPQKDIIPVCESAYFFQGYLWQAHDRLLHEDCTHYVVIGDDLLFSERRAATVWRGGRGGVGVRGGGGGGGAGGWLGGGGGGGGQGATSLGGGGGGRGRVGQDSDGEGEGGGAGGWGSFLSLLGNSGVRGGGVGTAARAGGGEGERGKGGRGKEGPGGKEGKAGGPTLPGREGGAQRLPPSPRARKGKQPSPCLHGEMEVDVALRCRRVGAQAAVFQSQEGRKKEERIIHFLVGLKEELGGGKEGRVGVGLPARKSKDRKEDILQ